MTELDLKRVKQLIIENFSYFDSPMNEIKIKMFAQELSGVTISELERAFLHFRKEPGRTKAPMPAEIFSFLKPKTDEKDDARYLAATIIGLLTKHGYSWAMGHFVNGETFFSGKGSQLYKTFNEALVSEVGEAGAHVINLMGGWSNLCERDRNESTGTIQAQLRDLCESTLLKDKNGTLNTPITLKTPNFTEMLESNNKSVLELMSGALKKDD